MPDIHHARSAAEAGYLCDLLDQHGIRASSKAEVIVVADVGAEARARAIVLDALADEDDDTVGRVVRWARWGRHVVAIVVLLLLTFAVTAWALGRANPLVMGVVFLLVLLFFFGGRKRRRRTPLSTDP